jgi:hypothetical protein
LFNCLIISPSPELSLALVSVKLHIFLFTAALTFLNFLSCALLETTL